MSVLLSSVIADTACRDVILIAGAFLYRYLIEYPRFGATQISKVNTFFQILLVVVVLFAAAFMVVPAFILTALMYIVLLTTLISLADYCWIWGRRAWMLKRAQA